MMGATKPTYAHKEAFCLMWYQCRECKSKERYWNSRDGVTPFGTVCPSCGGMDMMHVNWQFDECAPDHKPHYGQKVWVDMTRERAEAIAKARVADRPDYPADRLSALVESIYHDGHAPDLHIEGFGGSTCSVRLK